MQLGPLGLSSEYGAARVKEHFIIVLTCTPVVGLWSFFAAEDLILVNASSVVSLRFHVTVSKGSGRVYTNFVLSHFSSSAVVVARAAWSVFYIKPKTLLYIFAANDAAETISTANSEASGLQVQTGVYFL